MTHNLQKKATETDVERIKMMEFAENKLETDIRNVTKDLKENMDTNESSRAEKYSLRNKFTEYA